MPVLQTRKVHCRVPNGYMLLSSWVVLGLSHIPFQNWVSWFVLVSCSPPVTIKCCNFICLWIVLSSHFWGSHHLKPDHAIVVSQFSESQASVSGFKLMCDEISAPTLLTYWYSSGFQKMVHVGQQLFIYCCGNICSHSISTYKGTL